MKTKLLAFDYYFQVITFTLIMTGSVMLIPLMLLVPFGAYQILSASIKGFALDRYYYRVFALIGGIYGTTITWYMMEGRNTPIEDIFNLADPALLNFLWFLVYILVPVISAVYYIKYSYKDYKEALAEEKAANYV